jgi:hypothetical protein
MLRDIGISIGKDDHQLPHRFAREDIERIETGIG